MFRVAVTRWRQACMCPHQHLMVPTPGAKSGGAGPLMILWACQGDSLNHTEAC